MVLYIFGDGVLSGAELSGDVQCDVRDDVEQEDANLVECEAGIVDGIEAFGGELEPFAVEAINPIMGEG